jgi:D-alanyl-D-alanine carboxypeptidase
MLERNYRLKADIVMRSPLPAVFTVLACFSSATLGQHSGLEDAVRQAVVKGGGGGDNGGYSLAVHSPQAQYSIQSSWAGPGDKTPITDKTAFRIASITKTYVASTVLRLWEDGLVDLRSPISELMDPAFDQWMRGDGYDTDKILLIHLLTHTGGVYDHAEDPRYIAAIIEDPAAEWTPGDQVKACVDWGDPVGEPGQLYSYSDTGYVLVGNIIERITRKTLAASVRQSLNFEKLGITQTYWERFEKAPVDQNRAHQVIQGMDTYNWNPTIDLFGGGGLVATPADVALFFNKLLTGQVFQKPDTLTVMLSKGGLPEASPYRIGIFEYDYEGGKVYEHSGFWGTLVAHDPVTNETIAGAVIRRSDLDVLRGIIKDARGNRADDEE